jgi:ferredoxin
VEAIKPDNEPGLEKWLELNRAKSEVWPNITIKKTQPSDADNYRDEKGKFDKYFIDEPGEGD